MRKLLKTSFLGLLATAALVSCRKESVGPKLVAAGEDFKITAAFNSNTDDVDFKAEETVAFNATFSEDVTWKVRVKGLTTGSEKIFEGTTNKINSSLANWDGASDNIYFFKKWERCIGYLEIVGHDSIYASDTIRIAKEKVYQGKIYNGVHHIIIDDFDNLKLTGDLSGGISPDQADDNIDFSKSTNIAITGSNSFHMKGTDVNGNYWVGDINHENLKEFVNANVFIDTATTAENLYFNIFIFGTGAANSAVQLTTYEADTMKTRAELIAFSAIDNGLTFRTGENDAWIYGIDVTWEGWKMVSIPYSSFKPKADMSTGGSGNRYKEPWKIVGMAVSLTSSPAPYGDCDVYIDMVSVTENGGFVR